MNESHIKQLEERARRLLAESDFEDDSEILTDRKSRRQIVDYKRPQTQGRAFVSSPDLGLIKKCIQLTNRNTELSQQVASLSLELANERNRSQKLTNLLDQQRIAATGHNITMNPYAFTQTKQSLSPQHRLRQEGLGRSVSPEAKLRIRDLQKQLKGVQKRYDSLCAAVVTQVPNIREVLARLTERVETEIIAARM